MIVSWTRMVEVEMEKVNLFEGVNLTGMHDGLAMESEGMRRVKDDVVVLTYSMDGMP